jgi:Rrf2 family protein
MLALTKKTSYGLIAMVHLAKLEGDQVASAREIAKLFDIPMSLLMNVLKELASAGYVESLRGARGGYRLARRPMDINLADLIAAIEQPVGQTRCLTNQTGEHAECTLELMARCPVADPVHRVHRKLNDFLKKVTLAEILEPAITAGLEVRQAPRRAKCK